MKKSLTKLAFVLVPFTLYFMLGAVPALAVKPDCSVNSSHPSCKDDGTSPEGTMTPAGNWAFWDGPLVWEETPGSSMPIARDCGCSGYPNPQGQVGYVCHAGELFPLMDNLVRINLAGLTPTSTKGREVDYWCYEYLPTHELVFNVKEGLDYPYFEQPDDSFTSISRSYWYGMGPEWNDGPCYHGSDPEANCNVNVYTQAYFVPDDCTGRKCGRLVELQGWGRVQPVVPVNQGDVLEFNPFYDPQDI